MSYAADYPVVVSEARVDARVTFIRRTYAHLAVAILAFVGLETVLVQAVPVELLAKMVSGYMWLVMLGAFMVVAWVADRWARSDVSPALQYAGLALYVAAQAVIFLPLLYVAANFSSPDVIPKAAILTLVVFAGLTIGVFVTKRDFSFLRTILWVASFAAFGIILVSVFMGGGLGLWFSFAMVAVACGFILYDTSNVLHHYRTDQHVAASLALFASVALLFWYILRIAMSSDKD